MRTLNGDLLPWRLRPRPIPMPEESPVGVNIVRACKSNTSAEIWSNSFSDKKPLILPGGSSHTLELQAEVHSTAFLKWIFKADKSTQVRLKVTYSEGYEHEPRSYPFFRTKSDRLDAENGHLIGPHDDVTLDIPENYPVIYEPFWFRTFRILRLEITVGHSPVELVSFEAVQVNYPMAIKGSWKEPGDMHSEKIYDVSIRTLRNCMFDGYSDCPFYEQLQYVAQSSFTLGKPTDHAIGILVTVVKSGCSITSSREMIGSCGKPLATSQLLLPSRDLRNLAFHPMCHSSLLGFLFTGCCKYAIIIYTSVTPRLHDRFFQGSMVC